MSNPPLQLIELEVCMATHSWVNREFRRGMSPHPCGAPVWRISEVEVFPTFTTWGAAHQEVLDPVAQGRVQTQGSELNDELGGYYGVEC